MYPTPHTVVRPHLPTNHHHHHHHHHPPPPPPPTTTHHHPPPISCAATSSPPGWDHACVRAGTHHQPPAPGAGGLGALRPSQQLPAPDLPPRTLDTTRHDTTRLAVIHARSDGGGWCGAQTLGYGAAWAAALWWTHGAFLQRFLQLASPAAIPSALARLAIAIVVWGVWWITVRYKTHTHTAHTSHS
jgi:hypothetical protein